MLVEVRLIVTRDGHLGGIRKWNRRLQHMDYTHCPRQRTYTSHHSILKLQGSLASLVLVFLASQRASHNSAGAPQAGLYDIRGGHPMLMTLPCYFRKALVAIDVQMKLK